MKLLEALPFKGGGILSLIGGGGKTTTLLVLAEELQSQGKKVLLTTTTKLSIKMPYQDKLVLVKTEQDLIKWLNSNPGRFALLASKITADDKLGGIPVEWLERSKYLLKQWDAVIVEADGSKGKSIKANCPHEPVIPFSSSVVLLIIGVDILEKPLTPETAHRPELISKLTATGMGEIISVNTILELLKAEQGLLKGVYPDQDVFLVLNKYQSASVEQIEELIDQLLDEESVDIKAIVVTEMKDRKNPVKKVIFCV